MDDDEEDFEPSIQDMSAEEAEEMIVRSVSKGVLYGGLRLFLMVNLIVLGLWIVWAAIT